MKNFTILSCGLIVGLTFSCADATVNLRTASPTAGTPTEISETASTADVERPDTPKALVKLEAKVSDASMKLHQNSSVTTSFTVNADTEYSGKLDISLPSVRDDLKVMLAGKELGSEAKSFSLAELSEASLKIDHIPNTSEGGITFDSGKPAAPIKIVVSGEGTEGTEVDSMIEVSSVAVVTAFDPASNGGKMIKEQMITLTEGTGLCVINNYKDGLRLHGVPHQGNGGMGMGECYDKYGGSNKSMATLDTVTPCTAPGSDTMYDHDAGNIESLRFTVKCDPK